MTAVTADILLEDRRWSAMGLDALAERAFAAVLAHVGIAAPTEISLLACNDARIAALNADFRGKPQPTNVLSWPADERAAAEPGGVPALPRPGPDGMIELGDIAIAHDICAREATEAGRSLADHATHLIVHGVLHLLGYDHDRDADAALMERIEVEILGKLGISDPYRITQ